MLRKKYNGYNFAPRRWFKLKWVPCYEMVVSSVHSVKATDQFIVHINYRDLGSQFFETVNSKDFGLENLWSSIGGIVGIFLGYSVINIYEMMIHSIVWAHDKSKNNTDP